MPSICAAEGATELSQGITGNFFSERYLADAFEIYEQAGYPSYFEDLAWLWTENGKTRSALQTQIAVVPSERARPLQAALLKVLQINPNQVDALILSGKYHYCQNQKPTALWYLGRADGLRPDYEPAALSLADYYLAEGRPEQAIQALKDLSTPGAFLRKGVAALQQNQFHPALGYLLQAELYSGELAAVRNKDLAKVLRNLGDLARAKVVLEMKVPGRRIGRLLNQDVRFSCAILERNTQLALKLVESGRINFPEYPVWDFYQCLCAPQDQLAPVSALEPEYRAAIYLLQGQEYTRLNQLDQAYQSFTEALKADRKSLVGYYEAGVIQMKRKKIDAAIKLFSKGLELNPGFIPLLTKRALAYEQQGLLFEAEGDRTAARLVMTDPQPPLPVIISRSEMDETGVYLRQKSAKTIGLWFSTDGNIWSFSLWDRIAIARNAGSVWIAPAGTSVSGMAYRIDLKRPAVKWEPPALSGDVLEFRQPNTSRVVVDQLNAYQPGGWMAEMAGGFSRVALNHFSEGLQTLRIWYGLDDGTWVSGLYRINRVGSQYLPGLNFTVATDRVVTNERLIRLKVVTYGQATAGVKMAFGESKETLSWVPFEDDFPYRLSSGDGLKNIIVRFSDRTGQVVETGLSIELDTALPQLKDFTIHERQLNRYPLSWSVNEPVTVRLLSFSEQGQWNELTVSAKGDRFFAMAPLNSRLYQALMTDRAGNTLIYIDTQPKREGRTDDTIKFQIVGGTENTHIRNITIQPSGAVNQWAISNDLHSWSGWHAGTVPAGWRIGAAEGWQVVYIKYQWPDETGEIQTRYDALRVFYKPAAL